jgi:membrane associated rhomboid family serine protease
MIIIPTEKRFDWQHTPFVLFSIVALNILIFFAYQSGDAKKLQGAYLKYSQEKYLELEWPFFKKYLSQRNEEKTLRQYQSLYNEERFDQITSYILIRPDFYEYLRKDQYDYLQKNNVGDWFFIREEINRSIQSTSIFSFGLIPSNISIVSIISHQFLHGNLLHLLGNLFLLILCGFAVEAAIGHWRFLLFYLLSGIAGGLLHAVFNLKEVIPLVGASGAISGAMAMYMGIFRLKKIEFFYWFFVFVGYFRAPALFILLVYIGNEIFQYISALNSDMGSNIAFMAHVGGFLMGGLLTLAAHHFNPAIFNQEYIEEDQSIDPHREKLATVYDFMEKYQFDAAQKALTRSIEAFGNSFETAYIKYNLAKINKGSIYKQSVLELLATKNPEDKELKLLEKVWSENPDIQTQINHQTLLNLGLHLAKLSTPTTAESIFLALVRDKVRDSSLIVFAQRLSAAFGKIDDLKRKQKYDQIAEKLLQGHSQ